MKYTEQELINELKRVANKFGKRSISRKEFIKETGISEWQVNKYFDRWNNFIESADLKPYVGNIRIDDDSLLEEMYNVIIKENGIPSRNKYRKACKYSDWVYTRRFGSWKDSLSNFYNWVKVKHPDFPFTEDLLKQTATIHSDSNNKRKTSLNSQSWPKTGKRAYGPILNFRGLQHAPINEQGIVFLFGMIANELGFIVESIANEYPDCEAKRRIRGGQFERVKIEFEYFSRNFRDHGHDERRCDLIVCWEHNWPECTIDVVELREEISGLPS